MKNNKMIFHIDFDSYFVSAHRSRDIRLKKFPVAVSKGLDRSICSSISYELKNMGIKVGIPKYIIEKKAPNTIFVEPDFELYITLSNHIFDHLAKKYTRDIEIGSIDECWMDVTKLVSKVHPVILARKIQADIKKTFDIPLSIGISHTKWMAKMATGLKKPFGIKFIDIPEEIEVDIWPLDIAKYYGIGEKTAIKLRKIGIKTIGHLARASEFDTELYMLFRQRLKSYIDEANGNGNDQLSYEHNNLKGIGNELTFDRYDLDERREIYKIIKQISDKVSLRARNRNLIASTLTVIIRSSSKIWSSKQMKLVEPTNDNELIYKNAIQLFEKFWKEQPIRGVGVRLTNLINEFDYYKQLSIFETYEVNEQKNKVDNIINNLNKKVGKNVLKSAYQASREKVKESIQSRFVEDDVHIKK
ncbi:Y-family DNA polymerase [Mycoplasmopsis primatum]|uniref:Y-family DNA polymerase n=1 Tax=Mycoplasmopsis primatum TaxID=55604 RepID=UPI0004977754|nr:DNA polymerase IV [Mycoplasmopsis primatum]